MPKKAIIRKKMGDLMATKECEFPYRGYYESYAIGLAGLALNESQIREVAAHLTKCQACKEEFQEILSRSQAMAAFAVLQSDPGSKPN